MRHSDELRDIGLERACSGFCAQQAAARRTPARRVAGTPAVRRLMAILKRFTLIVSGAGALRNVADVLDSACGR